MYNNLKNNIQSGNDRINRLKFKILATEYKIKYENNDVNYNIKNVAKSTQCNTFKKLPYIQNNSDKLLISRGFFDCSNVYNDNQILDSNNNYYSKKTSNNYLIYNSGTNQNDNDLSFNTLQYSDISNNKEVFIVNTYSKKTRKDQLLELNSFNNKYTKNCDKIYDSKCNFFKSINSK